MSELIWDKLPSNITQGVSNVVLYRDGLAYPWSGVIDIKQAESSKTLTYFADGEKYSNTLVLGEISVNLSAYTYPDILDTHTLFDGIIYTVNTSETSYQINILYNVHVLVADVLRESSSRNPEITTINFTVETKRSEFLGLRPSAHAIVDSIKTTMPALDAVESALYGTHTTDPYLPTIDEMYELYESSAILRITDHGDGRWTAEAPGNIITMLDATTFQISWPSAVFIEQDSYKISSL